MTTDDVMYVVIVTGSRDWADPSTVKLVLSNCLEYCIQQGLDMILRVGDCKTGVDKFAREWAAEMGVTTHEYLADWDKHQLAAGPIRNSEMVDAGGDLCTAFWNGRVKNSGTHDCFTKAVRAGIKTELYGPEWTGDE